MAAAIEALRPDRVLLLDGGTGSELRRRGLPMRDDVWSALAAETHYELLRTIHGDYIAAGANVITTNTFATSRFVLEAAGLGARFETLNRAAVRAACEARELAERDVTIAGSMSCLPPRFDPLSYPDQSDEANAYGELAALLADAGAEVLALEMLQDARHAALACAAARATGLPFWIGVSCRERGSELVAFDFPGTRIADVLDALAPYAAAAINVMHTPVSTVAPALRAVAEQWNGPRGAYPVLPDAGSSGEDLGPPLSPRQFAAHARTWIDAGARIVGGCCGTAPRHIAALRAELGSG